jgi:hypothetical protein
MNTKVLLLSAVVTAFAATSFAAEPLLSPRAQANQIVTTPASAGIAVPAPVYVASAPALLSPRAQANQIQKVRGTDNNFNPALACRRMMSGSPKAVAACSDNPAMPGCQTVTAMK